ncbi:hypothetical protein LCGC14_2646890, partial [marine sediment metagenome]
KEGYNKILRYEALAELADIKEGKTIVDCSCGNGEEGRVIIERFKPKKYIGIDLDKKRLAKAIGENPEMKDCYIYGDIRDPLKEQFDYYFCVETLEHLPKSDNKKVAGVIYAAIKPGGKLLASVPGNPKIAMDCKGHKQIIKKKLLVDMFRVFDLEAEDTYIKYLPRQEAYSALYIFKKGD